MIRALQWSEDGNGGYSPDSFEEALDRSQDSVLEVVPDYVHYPQAVDLPSVIEPIRYDLPVVPDGIMDNVLPVHVDTRIVDLTNNNDMLQVVNAVNDVVPMFVDGGNVGGTDETVLGGEALPYSALVPAKGGFPWWLILVGVALYMIFRKNNKKQNW